MCLEHLYFRAKSNFPSLGLWPSSRHSSSKTSLHCVFCCTPSNLLASKSTRGLKMRFCGLLSSIVGISALTPPVPGPIPGIISWKDTNSYLRHCQFVLSCMANEPGNLDFAFNVVNSLNGNPSARSFQSVSYPTHFISIFNNTTGNLGVVETPDLDDASWEFTTPLVTAPPDATSVFSIKSAR